MSKISVIIPVYKAETFLRDCVDSVLLQTHRNLEVILVDDGSPDGSGAICDAYAQKDTRVRVIHQKNAGVSAARNAGLECATGEYLAFVDADDYIDADMYETLLRTAKTYDFDVTECNYRRNANTKPGTGKVHIHTGTEAVIKMFSQDGYPDGFIVAPWNKLIRREAAQKLRFLEGCSMAEDMLYTVELFCSAKKVGKIEKRLYTYRINEESATLVPYNVKKSDEADAVEKAMRVMMNTGDPTLIQIGCSRYIDVLLGHWLQCRAAGTDCREKAKELRKRFLADYPKVKNNLGKKQRVKCTLYRFAPGIYSCISK